MRAINEGFLSVKGIYKGILVNNPIGILGYKKFPQNQPVFALLPRKLLSLE